MHSLSSPVKIKLFLASKMPSLYMNYVFRSEQLWKLTSRHHYVATSSLKADFVWEQVVAQWNSGRQYLNPMTKYRWGNMVYVRRWFMYTTTSTCVNTWVRLYKVWDKDNVNELQYLKMKKNQTKIYWKHYTGSFWGEGGVAST
jgi:hypothetical protein